MNAQNNYEYVGAIKLNDTSLITYQIKFTVNEGKINGYSLTDVGGEHETKSNLYGDYNADEKFIRFREKDIVYTKSEYSENDFCFVNFISNKFKLGDNKIDGDFKGLFSDNTECISGEIILNSKEQMEKRIKKVQKVITKTKKIPDSLKKNYQVEKIMDSLNMNMLRDKQVLSVFSKSKDVKMVIYDGGREDGDNIDLKINNRDILKNYTITRKEKILPIKLSSKKTPIVLKANNVGNMSTNTAVIELYVDGIKIRTLTNLNKEEQTQINIYLK